ncbi:MAG: hypothetical protein WBC44_13130 [Planctomycetaceae bacterium]
MSRFASLFATGLLVVTGTASAQHHYDHYEGRYDRRGARYDDYRSHSIYHPSPSTYQPPRTNYVQPQSYYPQPSYSDPYGGSSHSYAPVVTSRPSYRGTYGGYSHVDDLAVQLEDRANDMCLEMYDNYQHNPGYKATYREAYQILQKAKYIHGLEHAGNRDRIRQAVVELDSLFHHVQDDVRNWSRHSHYYSNAGGLPSKTAAVEDTLHHLMNDVGVKTQFGR